MSSILLNNNKESGVNDSNIQNSNDAINLVEKNDLSTSDYWTGMSFIHILGNWSDAKTAGYCHGEGTFGEPYTLENITIDATLSPTGSGILIEDSKNDYFLIKNCTVTNSDFGYDDGGIKLLNSCNGTLRENNCTYNNAAGIFLDNDSLNNTIIDNNLNNNDREGIRITGNSDQNKLVNNTIKYNGIRGIYLTGNSHENVLINNTLIENDDYGIEINFCERSVLSNNELINGGIVLSGYITSIEDNIIYSNNTANDKPIYYYEDETNLKAINFTNAGQIILIGCTNSEISGYVFESASMGIQLKQCSNINVTNNRFTQNDRNGIDLQYDCNNIIISDNTFDYNRIGIEFYQDCDYNVISNNTVTSNSYRGISIVGSNNNTILNNTLRSNSGRGLVIRYFSEDNIVLNNTIASHSEYGVMVERNSHYNNVSENIIHDNAVGVFIEDECNYNNVSNNHIYDTLIFTNQLYGIDVYEDCLYNIISNNTIEGSDNSGIRIRTRSSNCTINDNKIIESNDFGIRIDEDSHNTTITLNTIKESGISGIYISSNCDFNNITSNYVNNSGTNGGIELEDGCDNNLVYDNEFSYNTYGISILDNCNSNHFTENRILDNGNTGFFIQDDTCGENLIYNNTFMGNTLHAKDDSNLDQNYWNNSIIGNYWDNYTGVDVVAPFGIGDTPYVSGNAIDYLPIYHEDIYEDNNDYTSAYDLSPYSNTWLSSIGGLGIQADEDWYEISVQDGYEHLVVYISFTHLEGDINLAIYNSSGFLVVGNNSATNNELIDYILDASGTYYIRVYGENSANSYDLIWGTFVYDDGTSGGGTVVGGGGSSSSSKSDKNEDVNYALSIALTITFVSIGAGIAVFYILLKKGIIKGFNLSLRK
ncbi:MAG: right-handed parallel beta-helix repeat-containing protein [Candidatus Hermodarchaeota archaeon]